jgi:hypothetical protein
MSDVAIAGMLLAFLIGLAVAAPIWGVDSRDGIESDQSARRVAWLHGGQNGTSFGRTQAFMSGRSAGLAVAGALRSAAHRIDADVASERDVHHQAALA